MAQSSIEWTEKTWNPTTGCNKISQGCKYCYADVMTKRLKGMGQEKYKNGFELTIHPQTLDEPRKWKSSIIFVNSMSDLFHENVPLDFIQSVFKTMNECPQHQFQVLTKRAERLEQLSPLLTWTENIWAGVSVENQETMFRIGHLQKTGAFIKFLSCEPLLQNLPDINLMGLDWVIVGGESGFKARPMKEDWVIDIKEQCKIANVPFFFKQWGGKNKKAAGRLLEGETYNEMPRFETV
jgi:protein gp37